MDVAARLYWSAMEIICRGVKSFVAEKAGAAGVIIYSDPIDDGYFRGDVYPKGPFRPDTAVQRGSIEYMIRVPGRRHHAGIASVPSLPIEKRSPPTNRRRCRRFQPLRFPTAMRGRFLKISPARRLARVAGRFALHLSRRSWSGSCPHGPQNGLPISQHLECRRRGAGK